MATPRSKPFPWFAAALLWATRREGDERRRLRSSALRTADHLSLPRTARHALRLYAALCRVHGRRRPAKRSSWRAARKYLQAEIDYLSIAARAAGSALQS